MTDDIKQKDNQACEAAKEFVTHFYEGLDKRRHVLSKFYLDSATLVWNGNMVTGLTEVIKYIDQLPPSTHYVEYYDAQAMFDEAAKGQTAILITTGGTVKYEGNNTKNFTQTFVLTTQNNTWKVLSDSFRTQE